MNLILNSSPGLLLKHRPVTNRDITNLSWVGTQQTCHEQAPQRPVTSRHPKDLSRAGHERHVSIIKECHSWNLSPQYHNILGINCFMLSLNNTPSLNLVKIPALALGINYFMLSLNNMSSNLIKILALELRINYFMLSLNNTLSLNLVKILALELRINYFMLSSKICRA